MKADPSNPINAGRIASHWNGVRMRKIHAGTDPDAPTRAVTLPADWEDDAAAALAQLAPGQGSVSLAQAASRWIGALGREPGAPDDLPARLCLLLLHRAAAPNQAVWQLSRTDIPAFTLNLAAFVHPGSGFDVDGFAAAIATVTEALGMLTGASGRSSRILLGNLDAALAKLGLDYDSDAARETSASLMALATATAHPDRVPPQGANHQPPTRCMIPALAGRARAAWQQASAQAPEGTPELFPTPGQIETGLSTPDAADALLGFEACGIAPIFSPLRPDGRLAESTLARLAARGMTPEAALAASLAGEPVLRQADFAAVQAMHRAVAPFIDRVAVPAAGYLAAVPPRMADVKPEPVAAAAPVRRELPSRHGGFTQKAVVGSHRLYLRTGEYADGSLGEISISAVRDGPAQRGLMDAFAQAVTIGLQHGVKLDAFVEAFAYCGFGPHGAVEGDASISSATSVLDYAFRTLAQTYLGRAMPDAPQSHETQHEVTDALLPLDLPHVGDAATRPAIRQRHGLRLVG